jgi:malonyl-CoA/methylmalonyl-CoA synthetase
VRDDIPFVGKHVDAYNLDAWRRHLGADTDPAALVAELAEGTLPHAFRAGGSRDPRRTALVIDDRAVTHEEVGERALRAAGWLRARDVRPGDRVMLCAPNSLELVVAYLGVLGAGAIAVPAGTALQEPELRHIAHDSGAVLACAGGEAVGRLRRIAEDHRSLRQVVELTPEGGLDGEPLAPPGLVGGAVAVLAYTSGTTGRPKGVPLTHANLLSSMRAVLRAWRWTPDDVLVHALPLSHQHGLGGIHAALMSGSRAVVHSHFDAARLCAAIEAERATVLFAVPAVYQRLLEWDGIGDADLSTLRLAVSGSAPLPAGLGRRISERLEQVPVERYGTTESGLNVSNPYDGPRLLGSVGLPLPGTELAIVDAARETVPAGDVGEIALRGPQVFSGYWKLPEATRESFLPGGWYLTGDLGRIDGENGYLTITGRSRELIISGGLNVYPAEVESVLGDHPGVREVAVVGVPSERWGEEVVAFVVPSSGAAPSSAELVRHAKGYLAAYKCPKRVTFVDALPRSEVGKVLRDALLEQDRGGRRRL